MSAHSDGVGPQEILQLDDLEACVERVFAAVRGLREDKLGLVLAIAQYGALWIAADSHVVDEPNEKRRKKMRGAIIHALLEHTLTSGKQYAEAMIAEGSIRGRTRPSGEQPGSWPAR